MQFSLRYDEEIWELSDHEKEVTILAIHWEITAKFHMVPIDYNGFWSFVYSKNLRCWWRHANERWKRLLIYWWKLVDDSRQQKTSLLHTLWLNSSAELY